MRVILRPAECTGSDFHI